MRKSQVSDSRNVVEEGHWLSLQSPKPRKDHSKIKCLDYRISFYLRNHLVSVHFYLNLKFRNHNKLENIK